MKILVLGDFHGGFPKKFEKIIKKEKINLIVSTGDYLPFRYRKLFFKYCYGKKTQLWEVIGKSRYKKLILKELKDGENSLSKLNKLKIPVFTVLGNNDHPDANDVMDEEYPKGEHYWNWEFTREAQFEGRLKKYKNIKRFDYRHIKFGDFVFIGARTHSFPGHPNSKGFKKHKKILNKLFKKFKKENKNGKVIFVSHNVPFNTKLDLITNKKAHKLVRGKHYGSKLVREIIDKYHPILHFGGHVHESKGIQKLGRTICINSGAAHEGKGTIIDIPEKEKIKVRFVR